MANQTQNLVCGDATAELRCRACTGECWWGSEYDPTSWDDENVEMMLESIYRNADPSHTINGLRAIALYLAREVPDSDRRAYLIQWVGSMEAGECIGMHCPRVNEHHAYGEKGCVGWTPRTQS